MKKLHSVSTLINKFKHNLVWKKLILNSTWLISDKVTSMVISLFVTSLVARYFGPEKYGVYNYALSFITLFSAFSTLGLENLTVKSIIVKEYHEGTILFTSLVLRVIGGLILVILSYYAIRILEPDDKNVQLLVSIMSLTMVFKSIEVIDYWSQAYQKAKMMSIIKICTYIIISLMKICLVLFGGNLTQYAIVYSIDAIITGFALLLAYFHFRNDKTKWNFSFKYSVYILSQSWYLILSGLMVTLYMQMDKIMLGYMLNNKASVGIYSIASQVSSLWYFIPIAIITSFKPLIMTKKQQSDFEYKRILQVLYTIIAWIGIFFGIMITIFSRPLILLLFGPVYGSAADILSVSIWAGTFALLGTVRSVWLLYEGLQRYTLIYTFVGFITNLVLNSLFIPIWGGLGAAVATLVAQFVSNVLSLAFFRETKISTFMILKAFSFRELKNLFLFNEL